MLGSRVLLCWILKDLLQKKTSNRDIYNNLNYVFFYNTSAGQTRLFQVQSATKFAMRYSMNSRISQYRRIS